MYDPKCEELAELFLEDSPELLPKVRKLAQRIQDTIEDWIVEATQEMAEGAGDPAREPEPYDD